MSGKIYGYVRVSTKDQNEARQLKALAEYKIPEGNIYIDKQSGKNFERPGWKKMLKYLNHESLLIVQSIDRLGRDYEEILEQWRVITKEKHADILVLDMPLLDTRVQSNNLTSTFIADLVLQILSYVAQTEREHIKKRQAEGIEAARLRGVQFGRPMRNIEDFDEKYKRWKRKEITAKEAAEQCGLSRTGFYKRVRKLE